MSKPPHYLSYLLRLWQTQDQDHTLWRASLESPGTGERQGFADLEDLVRFLRAQMEERERGSGGGGAGEGVRG